ncbi:MAG: A/G-specific adenine glycosylase [Candidatus Paceibacteria bacterium]
MSSITYKTKVAGFRRIVWAHYKKSGRHSLPWRKTHDTYRVLVSEVMLQQTQVDRVIPLYTNFIKRFPIAAKLAAATLADVLKSWQGLGYNRRAKMLQQAAKQLAVKKFRTPEELETLPGVGPYTARAVAAFAYGQDGIVIETNIRTAIIHHFFPERKEKISDAEIAEVLTAALPKGKAREWYSALMDYGAHLKRAGISHNVRTKSYAKQAKFTGSLREVRGAIVRSLATGPQTKRVLQNLFEPERLDQITRALAALEKEKLVQKKGARYALAD